MPHLVVIVALVVRYSGSERFVQSGFSCGNHQPKIFLHRASVDVIAL